jgi:hypothetical protein
MHDDSARLSLKVTKLNRLVESRYGLDLLGYKNRPEHIATVSEHYREKYEIIKKVLGENAIAFSPEAARAYLISEAARMLLREIAPKRLKKRKGSK